MPFWECGKYGRARQTTDDNVMVRRKGAICIPDNYSKNTDTPSEYFILTAFPRQKWLRERATNVTGMLSLL